MPSSIGYLYTLWFAKSILGTSELALKITSTMALLLEAKQIVSTLTDTKLLLKGYDQGAEAARTFTKGLPKTILNAWSAAFPAQKREPIPPLAFLGGHPRSGTTLLEQVLDAHPAVAALDEPPAFLKLLQPEFHRSKDLSAGRLNTLRHLYTQALLLEAGPSAQGKLLVDKNPSPTGRLPLWLRVFPELRVLIALRDPRDVERTGEAVLDAFGTVHAVVANAAVNHASLAVSTSDEAWQEVIDTNLTGAFYVVRQFLPEFLANRWGRIITFASGAEAVGLRLGV
jgi:hypothetical protein